MARMRVIFGMSTPWCLAFLAAIALSAAAQEAPETGQLASLKEMTLEQLSQIEITSVNKEPTPAFRTPAAISVLTSDQIHQSGVRTIPDLLRLIPGVNVSQIDSSQWAIGIRGFQGKLSKSVLVLIDGRSVYTPLFAGVYWDMQDVMIEDIDRIEVIRGPGGTIWGSNAVDGVINIITKNARDTHGTLVTAGTGSMDQGELAWRYGGGGDKLSYRIYGKGFSRAPDQHPDGRNFDDWRRGQTGFRLDSKLSGTDQLTLSGDVYGGEAGQALQVSTYTPPSIPTHYADRTFNGQNVMAAWQRTLASGGDIQLRAYFDRTERHELNYREIRNTFDIDFIHHLPLPRNDVTWGLGARISPSHFFQTVPTVDFTPHHQTYNIFSAFAQDEIALRPDRLSFTIGSKFEHTTFSGFNAQPSARLAWTPTGRDTVWAAVTRAIRTASRIEDGFSYSFLAVPALPLYLRLVGDGGFTQENMTGYEAGIRHSFTDHGSLDLSLFHDRYHDLLSVEAGPVFAETSPTPAHLVLPILFRNGIAANTTGGEISALWDLKPWWRAQASYALALVDARHEPGSIDASTIGQLEGDTPAHSVVARSTFQIPHNFDIGLTYRFVSAIPDQKVVSYSTGDISAGWRPHESVEFRLVGSNLFSPAHPEYGGDPGPLVGIVRSIYFGITVRR
ncbi:MAG TPA: TonB-dependent receptor plug domain-containing protein [Bryobacteraceae bacterium]|nr:TonB-dependent receptor plug domain-containing protein [Bryobacteraceae bacterium]